LIPALLVLLVEHRNIWQSGILARSVTGAAFASQVWQWAAAIFLSLCSLIFSMPRLRASAGVPNYTALSVAPLTVLAVLVAFFTVQNSNKTAV
jgi:hypothetical protein